VTARLEDINRTPNGDIAMYPLKHTGALVRRIVVLIMLGAFCVALLPPCVSASRYDPMKPPPTPWIETKRNLPSGEEGGWTQPNSSRGPITKQDWCTVSPLGVRFNLLLVFFEFMYERSVEQVSDVENTTDPATRRDSASQ